MKSKKTEYWPDMTTRNGKLYWGVESSNKDDTFDGHYVLIVFNKDADKGYEMAARIAATFNAHGII